MSEVIDGIGGGFKEEERRAKKSQLYLQLDRILTFGLLLYYCNRDKNSKFKRIINRLKDMNHGIVLLGSSFKNANNHA